MSRIGGLVMAFALTACNGSDTSSATTTSTLQIAPPTTAEQATTIATSSTTTTTATAEAARSTTAALATAPPTTTVEDQLNAAIERAQTAMRNCYAALPAPCDRAEMEAALVGAQLDRMIETATQAEAKGYRVADLNLQWTLVDGPQVLNDELAVATVCRYDASVTVDATGAIVNDEAQAFVQTWHLLPVGSDWKLGETINEQVTDNPASSPCE